MYAQYQFSYVRVHTITGTVKYYTTLLYSIVCSSSSTASEHNPRPENSRKNQIVVVAT